ncbi:MAG TPA: TraB/GumN family protein [Methanocorpusculum sp.]|nr:TraB/GumN family protein [Methanocorpusculum sp.]
MTEIHLVGTAHVSQKSVDEVRATVDAVNPDVIAVELDAGRAAALRKKMREEETGVVEDAEKAPEIKSILKGNFTVMIVQWLLAYVQRKIGLNVGVEPGSEMIAAMKIAEERHIPLLLIDRDISITIGRFWGCMKFTEKVKLIWVLLKSVFGADGDETEEIDGVTVDQMTSPDIIEMALEEFHKFTPGGAKALIDERDAYLAHGVINIEHSAFERAVIVLGAGHLPGIARFRENPSTLPPMHELNQMPKKFPWGKLIGGVVIFMFAVIILAIAFSGATELLIWAIIWWVLINGSLAGIATLIARGHPLAAATAAGLSWMTSLNPFLACGWFAAIVQAKFTPPHGTDLKAIGKAESLKEMCSIPLFKILLVAAAANIGSILGTVCFFVFLTPVLGVSVDAMKDLLFQGFVNMWNCISGFFAGLF